MTVAAVSAVAVREPPAGTSVASSLESEADLLERIGLLESRVRKAEERRRALVHIMGDMNELNKRLGHQRKAMLHILVDYEQDRRRLGGQTERLDNSRRALLHILKDVNRSNQRLEGGRKAMIHIMDDLRRTSEEVQRREQELRDKQEQLVQAGKLATVGELTTGIAHELNNPLNNIGLFVGNAIDLLEFSGTDRGRVLEQLRNAMLQVRKAIEIISHLRTFGRAAPSSREPVRINDVVTRALELTYEQLRLRQVEVRLDLCREDPVVDGNAIQLEQVFINLLTNARDALASSARKLIHIASVVREGIVRLVFQDTGPGIAAGSEQRIFDPFFTTKDVGAGTGLGLSIAYGIIKDHGGAISILKDSTEPGAVFLVELPLLAVEADAAPR